MQIQIGRILSIQGADLTTSYQRGTAIALEGADLAEVRAAAAFKGGTAVTSTEFQFQVSDDLTNWDAVACILESTDEPLAELSIAASAGNTVAKRIMTASKIQAKYITIAAKITGGPAASGDGATGDMTAREGRFVHG